MGIGQDASDEGLTVTRVSADGVQGETFDYVVPALQRHVDANGHLREFDVIVTILAHA